MNSGNSVFDVRRIIHIASRWFNNVCACKDSGNDFLNSSNKSLAIHEHNLQLLKIEILKTKNNLNLTVMKESFAEKKLL